MLRLRARYTERVRALATPRAAAVGAAVIALHVGLWVAAAALLPRAWAASPAAAAALVFFIGAQLRALGNVMHECAHGTFVRGRRANAALGHLLSFIDFADFARYQREHLTHHRHLGHPTRDLDFAARRDLFRDRGLPFVVQHVLRPLSLFHLPRYLAPVVWNARDARPVALARMAFNLALLAACARLGWATLAAGYLLPYVTAYQVFRYWSDAADHAGLHGEAEEFYRTRNHAFGSALLNWIVFPRSDQYHLVHHLFPLLPTHALREAHGLLMNEPEYAARRHDVSSLVAP